MPRFWKRKRRDGKPGGAWWTNLHGRRVSTGCEDRRAAEIWVKAREREGADPRFAAAQKACLADAIRDLYADLRNRGASEATQGKVRGKLGHFARLWGTNLPLSRINATLVSRYVETRLSEPATPSGSRTVKRLTVRDELAALRQLLRLAKHNGTFPHHHEDVLPLAFDAGPTRSERFHTREQFEALLAHVEPRHAAHICFIVATGARRGESYRARRADVDTREWRVTLRRTKTKNSPTSRVSIDPIVRPYLLRALRDAEGDDIMFIHWHNMPRDMKLACERAGVPPVTARDIRRSFGKWHRSAGYEPSDIAVLLGHTTSKLAEQVYGTVDGGELRGIVQARAYKKGTHKSGTHKSEIKRKAGKK